MSERPHADSIGGGIPDHQQATNARPQTAHGSGGGKIRRKHGSSRRVHRSGGRDGRRSRPKSSSTAGRRERLISSPGRMPQQRPQKNTFRSWRKFPRDQGTRRQQRRRPFSSRPGLSAYSNSGNLQHGRLSPLSPERDPPSYGPAYRIAPRSPEDIEAAHDTWRDIDLSGLDMSPLRAVSSESIILQQAVQQCIERLASMPFGDAGPVFSELSGHTSKCLRFLERNLSSIAAESSSVDVCQQAMHALSHSTVLQRVWADVTGFVDEAAKREATAFKRHSAEMQAMRQSYESRIVSLEQRVAELTPEPIPEENESNSDSGREDDADAGSGSGGIVGKFTLDARDRNRGRRYSDADSRLGQIHKSLLKVHESEVAEEMTTRSRLEIRQEEATKERARGSTVKVTMNPAGRHVMLESFMKMLSKVDETCKVHMLEELFMCFKGEQRVAALAGMLDQISRLAGQHLMGDMLCSMNAEQKSHFLHVLVQVCDASTKEILIEKICASTQTQRRRELLHEQIDMLPSADMLGVIEDLISESLQENQRLTFVDNICAYLSPGEKRECILNMLFGVAVQSPGTGYKEGDMLTLRQVDARKGAVVEVMQVTKDGGGIRRVALRVAGEGHVAGRATCSGGGNDDAAFVLTPSTKSQARSMLQKLGLVLEDVRQLLERRRST